MSSFLEFLKRIFLALRRKKSSKTSTTEKKDKNVVPSISSSPSIAVVSVKDIKNDIFVKALPKGNYFEQDFTKDMIVLHFTAGHKWEHAYDTFLRAPYEMATAFIIDKEGPKYIVQLFDEKYWAYHLGIKRAEHNRNRIHGKRSIGVEIVNIGPVWFRNGGWEDNYKNVWPDSSIVRGKNRDADGGVKFPDEQVEAVCRLVNHLCDKWNIPRQVPKDKMSFQLPGVGEFKGIVAHQMFREDKYDMGVAWPWEKMIKKCKLKEV